MTIETDPLTFARNQTADRLADRFEDSRVDVRTGNVLPKTVFITGQSDRKALVIEDELDDLGHGISIQKQIVTNPNDGEPEIEVRFAVDRGIVGLHQAIAHLEDEFTDFSSNMKDSYAEATINDSVSDETFLSVITEIQSAYDVQIIKLDGWQTESWFDVTFAPETDS